MNPTRAARSGRWLKVTAALAITGLLALGAFTGCDDDLVDTVSEDELAPPLGLRSVTGNEQVTLFWYTSNFEDGFEGYMVFQDEDVLPTNVSAPLPAGFEEVDRIDIAASNARVALTKAWEHRDRRIACWNLITLARVALARGESALAGRLWGATEAELEETGVLAGNDDLPHVTEQLRAAGDALFAEGLAIGRTEPLEAAVALGQTAP